MRNSKTICWFSCGSSILVELEFGDDGFCGGRKTGVPREKPLAKARTNNKLSAHIAPGRNRAQATLARGTVTTAPSLLPCIKCYIRFHFNDLLFNIPPVVIKWREKFKSQK